VIVPIICTVYIPACELLVVYHTRVMFVDVNVMNDDEMSVDGGVTVIKYRMSALVQTVEFSLNSEITFDYEAAPTM
jgi:hypothetical protein